MLRQIIKSFSNHHLATGHTMAIPVAASLLNAELQSINHINGKFTATNTTDSLAKLLTTSTNPVALLENTISTSGYVVEPLQLGQQADPYRADDKVLGTTREILQALLKHNHPVEISTKSHLIVKDVDLLAEMSNAKLCTVTMGLSTLDEDLKMNMEPRTSSPTARLGAIQKLAQAGIPVNVMVSPIIPLINDGELEQVLKTVKEAGATLVGYELLQLSNDIKPMFLEWLDQHYPSLAKRAINLVYCSFNGKDERSEFSKNMSGSGVFAAMLEQRFQHACDDLALQQII